MKKTFYSILSVSFLFSSFLFAASGHDAYSGYNPPRKSDNTVDKRIQNGRYCPVQGQQQYYKRTQAEGRYCPHCDNTTLKQRNKQEGYYNGYSKSNN